MSAPRYRIKVAGTGDRPFVRDDWRARYGVWRCEHGDASLFPRRPALRQRDRLVVYAAGSAAAFGDGRLFAIEEVLSPEPEPSGHPRWPWQLRTRELVSVPLLSCGAHPGRDRRKRPLPRPPLARPPFRRAGPRGRGAHAPLRGGVERLSTSAPHARPGGDVGHPGFAERGY